MAATGRPRFEPTEKQRGQVEAMARYGIPETEIARTIGVSKPTLLKYFRDELDTGATKANAQVGEFIFSTILGVPIPGRPPVSDERARATLAIFWAKTRMHWKETNVHEHSGKHGNPIEVSTVRERITRRLARLAAESTTSEDPEESE
jgi:AcrR family transcriptional regulator